jgi:hypothetical protein
VKKYYKIIQKVKKLKINKYEIILEFIFVDNDTDIIEIEIKK